MACASENSTRLEWQRKMSVREILTEELREGVSVVAFSLLVFCGLLPCATVLLTLRLLNQIQITSRH
jgi:hypothetical protein